MKKFLSFHFKSYWFIYLIYLLISILLSSTLIINITKTPSSKKIDIFIGSPYELNEGLKEHIDNNKMENIKEVNISYYDYDSMYFGTYYASKAMKCDIVILPIDKNVIDDDNIYVNMSRLEKDNINEYFSFSFDYYEIEEYKYGIKIYDGNIKDGYLKNLFKEDDVNTYYLFFSSNSIHTQCIDYLGIDNASLDIMKVINSYVIQ